MRQVPFMTSAVTTPTVFIRCSLMVLLLILSGCQPKSAVPSPGPGESGSVFLYLKPFSQEAQRLGFTLSRIAALRKTGEAVPLAMTLDTFTPRTVGRQRLVASGRVPAGDYRGLSFTVKGASLVAEDGESALLVPEAPVVVELPFRVVRNKAAAFFLVFNYRESIQGGYRFSPVFSAFLPRRPVTGLLGYVSDRMSNTVTVFNKISGEAVAVLGVGREPRGIAIDSVRRMVYVALAGEDAIDVIDMDAWDTTNRIRLRAGDAPRELALVLNITGNARGGVFEQVLLTVNEGSNTVSFVDPVSFVELERIAVGKEPSSILIWRDPAGVRDKAYVFNTLSNTISVVDIVGRKVVAVVPTEIGPYRGQFSRGNDRLYVIYQGTPYLIVLDPFTFSEVKRVLIGAGASALKIDTKTDMIYLAQKMNTDISVFDPFSLIPVNIIPATSGVVSMAIDDETNNLLLLSSDMGTLTAVSLNSNKVVSMIDVGRDPYWVSVVGER